MRAKKTFILKVFQIGLFIGLFFVVNAKAHAATEITSNITTETVWKKEGSPYIIRSSIHIEAPLVIEPGVVVRFKNRSTGFAIKSSLRAIGTQKKKIVFTSLCDRDYGDVSGYCLPQESAWKWDWEGIFVEENPNLVVFDNVVIKFANHGIFNSVWKYTTPYKGMLVVKNSSISFNNSGGITIRNTEPVLSNLYLSNNQDGLDICSGMSYPHRKVTITNSSIVNNKYSGILANCFYKVNYVDARNNWWGSASGPRLYNYPPGTSSSVAGDYVIYDPWLTSEPVQDAACTENCYSNVLFLPGIKASRLYKEGGFGEDKLWPPNYFGNDIVNLFMRNDGSSIENVCTKDVLDEVGIPGIGGNLYKTFLEQLSRLKNEGSINDYNVYAYDWRKNIEDIAKNGTAYPSGEIKTLIDQIQKLSQSSKSEKVTIVAHSNGGLLAKAIMLELQSRGLTEKVDKIIFVGTPQMGTPLATLSLLYGYDESLIFGTLLSRARARELAENMPGAYGLLPSEKYFERLQDPMITINGEHTRYRDFENAYGEKIDSIGEFKSFLIGEDDERSQPDRSDVESEETLNEVLIQQAIEMHERLDNWTPPENVEVIQVAGWGLDTVRGIKYWEKEKFSCTERDGFLPICKGTGEFEPIYEPTFTVDGDKVVTAPSALMLSQSSNVERYWVDLKGYNDQASKLDREHKNILELNSVNEFLNKILTNSLDDAMLPEYVWNQKPSLGINFPEQKRIRMSLYSPLDIHLYDEDGNHTGPKQVEIDGKMTEIFEQAIPNSYYYEFGNRKYVGFDEKSNISAVLDSYDKGSFTLKIDEIDIASDAEEIISHVAFENLPTLESSKITFDIPSSGLEDMSKIKADLDDDGNDDYVVEKVMNGSAVLDAIPPVIEIISPKSIEYINNQKLSIDYSVSDEQTGVAQQKVFFDGVELSEVQNVDLSLILTGKHIVKVEAIDKAGNESEKEVEFEVTTSINAISENIDHYFELGLITDKKTAKYLHVKIEELRHAIDMIEKQEGNENLNPVENQQILLNKKIEQLKEIIGNKFSDVIDLKGKELLIDSLNYLK